MTQTSRLVTGTAMATIRLSPLWRLPLLLLALLAALPLAVAADETLKLELVWGTNDDKPPAKSVREAGPKLTGKLSSVFKWKNYFIVNEEIFTLPKKARQPLELSNKCHVVVRDIGDGNVEVDLLDNKGESFKKLTKSLKQLHQGDHAVIGGEDKTKWGDAWFVVLSIPKDKRQP